MAGERCGCGAWKVPALRYDAFGRHEVMDCFEGQPECRWPYVERLPADCAQCGTPLTKPQARFCSKACQDRSRYRERVPVICICGVEFEALPWEREKGKGRFCSHRCSAVSRHQKRRAS